VKACSAPGGREKPLPSWRVTIRIPGFRGGGGGAAFASDAAGEYMSAALWFVFSEDTPMPFGSLGSTRVALLAMLAFEGLGV
jgi:hypothetical protein